MSDNLDSAVPAPTPISDTAPELPPPPRPTLPLAPVRADPKLAAIANGATEEKELAPLPALTIAQGITPAEPESEEVEISMSEYDDIAFIKAKTMFGIVDEVYDERGGGQRVLFLSARQTSLIAKDITAIRRMLFEGFEAPMPGLVIQLLFSPGFTSPGPHDTDLYNVSKRLDHFMNEVLIPLAAENHAIVFVNADRSCGLSESFIRVASLMRNKWGDRLPFTVISIVLDAHDLYTNPNKAAHWRRLRDASRAWSARNAHLRTLVNAKIEAARAAGNEHGVPASTADLNPNGGNFLIFDRSSVSEWEGTSTEMANALVDAMRNYLTDDATGLGLPSIALKAGEAAFLGLENTAATPNQYASSLQPALDVLQGGTPLLLIDGFKRPVLSEEDRISILEGAADIGAGVGGEDLGDENGPEKKKKGKSSAPTPTPPVKDDDDDESNVGGVEKRNRLFEWAKDEYIKQGADMRARGQSYNHDVGTLAYFLDVLGGDGDSTTVETAAMRRKNTGNKRISLGQAIDYHDRGMDLKGEAALPPANNRQMREAMEWLSAVSMEEDFHTWKARTMDAFDALDGKQAAEVAEKRAHIEQLTWEIIKKDGWPDKYRGSEGVRERLSARLSAARLLMKDPNCHGVNLSANPTQSYKLLQELVQADRLPSKNSFEALCLMRQAWDEYDVASYLAWRYKITAKCFFYLQLLLAFAVIIFAQMDANATAEHAAAVCARDGNASVTGSASSASGIDQLWVELVFATAVASFFLISFDQYVNAKPKWRELRGSAGQLHSWIWCFRARVAPFVWELGVVPPVRPENVLKENLVKWRNGLAQVGVGTLRKRYSHKIYRHHQRLRANGRKTAGKPLTDYGDDHFSPIRAAEYISWRVRAQIHWYQRRIPRYAMRRTLVKMLALGVTVAAAVLAKYGMVTSVVLATSFGSAITAYQEYNDNAKKIDRYNRAISGLENLLTWWEALSRVERASEVNIAKLVHSGEQSIEDERIAWLSTSSNGRDDDGIGQEAMVKKDDKVKGNQVAPAS